jgi:hypothetical protein
MAQGIKALRRIQMGAEDTAGTAVAATSYWRGVGTIQDNRVTEFPEEDIGILPGVDRSYVPKVEALLSLESTPATFEQLPYLFEMGIQNATPTTDSDSSGVYSYTVPVASTDARDASDLKTYTFEGGDNAAAEEFAYGFVQSLTLDGNAGEGLMMSAEVVGRQVAPTTDAGFTAGLSIPSVEEILFSKGSLYLDGCESTDTIGTTKISNEFLSMNFSYTTGWTPVYTADGNIYFSFIKQVRPEAILQITFEHNTNSIAAVANWRAQTAQQIRVHFDGNAATHDFVMDMAGKWDNFEKIGEQDGNDIISGTFRGRYNSTAALFLEFVVKNDLAALP